MTEQWIVIFFCIALKMELGHQAPMTTTLTACTTVKTRPPNKKKACWLHQPHNWSQYPNINVADMVAIISMEEGRLILCLSCAKQRNGMYLQTALLFLILQTTASFHVGKQCWVEIQQCALIGSGRWLHSEACNSWCRWKHPQQYFSRGHLLANLSPTTTSAHVLHACNTRSGFELRKQCRPVAETKHPPWGSNPRPQG